MTTTFIFELLGYVFQILGIIAGGQIILESLFQWTLLKGLLEIAPIAIRQYSPQKPTPTWLQNKGGIFVWYIAIFYLVALTLYLSISILFWLSIFWAIRGNHFSLLVAIVLGAIQAIINLISAGVQVGATLNLKTGTYSDKIPFIFLKYFIRNWFYPAFVDLELLVIVMISLVINFPAWIIELIRRKPINLSDRHVYRQYCFIYAFVAIFAGTVFQMVAFLVAHK